MYCVQYVYWLWVELHTFQLFLVSSFDIEEDPFQNDLKTVPHKKLCCNGLRGVLDLILWPG
jgi:hypothetical protein